LEAKSVPILFVGDASVLIAHANPMKFKNTINEVYVMLDDWFKINLMTLNTMKTNYINFTVKNKVVRDIGTIITSTNYTEFLGLTIQYEMTWDGHTEEIIKKLSTACYRRNIKTVVSVKTLKSIYY
jgi:hypothetical protein